MQNLTKEQRIKLFDNMYAEGLKDSQIARILEINESVVNQIRWSKNLKPNGRGQISDSDFIELAKTCETKTEIAKKAKISEAAVTRRIKKLGIVFRREKINERHDEFMKLYNSGMSDSTIAKTMHFGLVTIQDYRSSLKLEANNSRAIEVDHDKFIALYNEYKTDAEIAYELGVSQGCISGYRKKLNMPCNKSVNKPIELSNTEYQVLIGTILGDTSLSCNKAGNVTGSFNHCMKQKEFAMAKYEYLKNICSQPRIYKKHDERLKVKDYEQIAVIIRSFPGLKDIYNKFYINNKKIAPKDLLESLDGLGLAIWYMDDGSNAKYGYVLCTNGFSDEDRKTIQSVFKNKFSINTTIHKDGKMYIKADSKQTFKSLVKPYIIPSMHYKL